MIRFYRDGTDFRPALRGRVAEWLRACARAEGRRVGAVNFVFCSPERQLQTNRDFLGHDWPTDVITFDYSAALRPFDKLRAREPVGEPVEPPAISGDIFVDPAEVARNAERFLVDPRVEMRRVMVHGVLHLCGYGDKSPAQQRRMRAKEDFYLARFYGAYL